MKGIDWPVREVRQKGGSLIVTIPPHFRCYLGLEPKDWISFWKTYWLGYLLGRKLTADQKGLADRDGRRSHPLMITQVQGIPKSIYMVIPKGLDEMLGVKLKDKIVFGWTLNEGEFSMAGVLGGRKSEGDKN
jgi:antitoxin component of MazEF toxin-antitoxin module